MQFLDVRDHLFRLLPPTRHAEVSRASLVYLDQCAWQHVIDDVDLTHRLRDTVRRGTLVAPVSLAHWIETMKAHPKIRARMFPIMAALSRGYLVANAIVACRLEAQANVRNHDSDWVRARLLAPDLASAMGVGGWPRVLLSMWNPASFFAWGASGIPVDAITARVHSALDRSLAVARRQVRRPSGEDYVRGWSASEYSPYAPASHPSVAWLIALRDYCQSSTRELTRNDIIDITTVAPLIPYFDLIVCDRQMCRAVQVIRKNSGLRSRATVASGAHGTVATLTRLVDRLNAQRASLS